MFVELGQTKVFCSLMNKNLFPFEIVRLHKICIYTDI